MATPTTFDTILSPADLAVLAHAIKQSWRGGAAPDAVGVLRPHPPLMRRPTLVVDLAFEEFCLREEADQPVDIEDFCRLFPVYRSQIRLAIQAYRQTAEHPEYFDPVIPSEAWPAPGDEMEGLRIVAQIGMGSFARVYFARDLEAGDRPVVLKLSPIRSGEAAALGVIHHSSVVAVLWARKIKDFHGICMPFVGSATLSDAIQVGEKTPAARHRSSRGILDVARQATDWVPAEMSPPAQSLLTGRESYTRAIAIIASHLADAVEYHESGISHGDLKPTNVILGLGGQPYLIDFNLSQRVQDPLMQTGGTLPYMPPERLQIMLDEKGFEEHPKQGDVYAFGVMLFEALSGKVPFEPLEGPVTRATVADLLHREKTTPLSMLAMPGIPCGLARVIRRCLDPVASRRPAMATVKRDIERYLRRKRQLARALMFTGLAAAAAVILIALPVGTLAGTPNLSPIADTQAASEPAPTTADDFFKLGVKHLREGVPSSALVDFNASRRLNDRDGRTTAYLAYCLSLSGQNGKALGRADADALDPLRMYQRAIEKYHYAQAWAYNNWAFSITQKSKLKGPLEEALKLVEIALTLDPKLRPAHYNHVYFRYLGYDPIEIEGIPEDRDALDEIKGVMSTGPYTANQCYEAALMVLSFGGGKEENLALAESYLLESIKLGRDPQRVVNDRILRLHLQTRPDFIKLGGLPPAKLISTPNPHLAVPPIDD